MKKRIVVVCLLFLTLFTFSPLAAFAEESVTPVTTNGVVSQSVQEEPVTTVTTDGVVMQTIPEGAKNISAVSFDRGLLSPDIYLSSRLIDLVLWGTGGALSVLLAAIPVVGPQLAASVLEVIKGYTGSTRTGVVIHFTNGLFEYVEAQ